MTPHSCKEFYDKIKDTPEYQQELELYDREEAKIIDLKNKRVEQENNHRQRIIKKLLEHANNLGW